MIYIDLDWGTFCKFDGRCFAGSVSGITIVYLGKEETVKSNLIS